MRFFATFGVPMIFGEGGRHFSFDHFGGQPDF